MKKILFLTFNDAPSGIFSSQVIDVCLYWGKMGFDVKLVSFISLRKFLENRKKIRSSYPEAIVLPMFPKAGNWRMNRWLVGKQIRSIDPDTIVCRGVFATILAMEFRAGRKICFDARGAYEAELNEYDVIGNEKVKKDISMLERKAILESDFRLAVSNQLVNYWKNKYFYNSENHVVIPCTLNSKSRYDFKETRKNDIRKSLEFAPSDKVIVYAGSSAGWQSLKSLDDALLPLFASDTDFKLLLLSNGIPDDLQLSRKFPDRVKAKWVDEKEVVDYLSTGDFGWLVRENTVTNQVASPVKFAEYLASGLEIIISQNLGDYSNYVVENNVGIIWSADKPIAVLHCPDAVQKKRIGDLAKRDFVKEKYRELYLKLLS